MKTTDLIAKYAAITSTADEHTTEQIEQAVRLLLSEPGRLTAYLWLYQVGHDLSDTAGALAVSGHTKFMSHMGGKMDRMSARSHSEASFQRRNAADRLTGYNATLGEVCRKLTSLQVADEDVTEATAQEYLRHFEARAFGLPVLDNAVPVGRWFRRFRKTDESASVQARKLAAAIGADGIMQVLIPAEQIGAKRPWLVWQPATK